MPQTFRSPKPSGQTHWSALKYGLMSSYKGPGLRRPLVAVGTRISPRPPHRSRRALLTHRAPPSGSGVEAVTGQRVYGSDWRKEARDELDISGSFITPSG